MVSRATEHVVDDVKRVVANVKHVNKTFVDDVVDDVKNARDTGCISHAYHKAEHENEIFDPAFAPAHHESDLG